MARSHCTFPVLDTALFPVSFSHGSGKSLLDVLAEA